MTCNKNHYQLELSTQLCTFITEEIINYSNHIRVFPKEHVIFKTLQYLSECTAYTHKINYDKSHTSLNLLPVRRWSSATLFTELLLPNSLSSFLIALGLVSGLPPL